MANSVIKGKKYKTIAINNGSNPAIDFYLRDNLVFVAFTGVYTISSSAIGNCGTITDSDFIPSRIMFVPIIGEYNLRIGTDGTVTIRKGADTTSLSAVGLFAQGVYYIK